jgi:hypothetical protein
MKLNEKKRCAIRNYGVMLVTSSREMLDG